MAFTDEDILSALRTQVMGWMSQATILAKIKSVDTAANTCVLIDDDGNEIPDVRLRVVDDGSDGLTIYPTVNNWGLALQIEHDGEWQLVACGNIDKWRLHSDQAILELNSNGLLVQNGSDTLREALTLIIEAIQPIIVMQGRGPDLTKLQSALGKVNNILR